MIATISVDMIVEAAGRVGVHLHKVHTGGNLYLWHTRAPELAVVYIGKSASDVRLKEEQSWQNECDPRTYTYSGIVTLLRVNQAIPQALLYLEDSFDSTRWRTIRDEFAWTGPALDHLDETLPVGAPLPAAEVEKLLVRIAVRYGVPVGNSQFASQWEGPIGSATDTLAALAVLADPSFEIPAPPVSDLAV